VSEQWGQPDQPSGEWSIPQGTPTPPPSDSQSEFGAPPQQNLPFGAPVQPGFGDPAYGYPAPAQPAQPAGSNGLAIAGFVLAFLFWPLGLVFSLIGIRRANGAGGKGKGLAIAGVAVSILALLGTIGVFVLAANAPAVDPGCTTAESQLSALDTKINADQGNESALIADLNTAKSDLDSSVSVSEHANVRNAISLASSDLGTFLTDLQSYIAQQGSGSVTITQIDNDSQKLQTDANAVDSLCSSL
jgi:hypothetical protein